MVKENQFLLLLWKNYILQKRRPIATVVELSLPLLFAALLIVIRTQVEIVDYNTTTTWRDFKVDGLPSFDQSSLPKNHTFILGYVPQNDSFVEKVLKAAINKLNQSPKSQLETKCQVSLEELEDIFASFENMSSNGNQTGAGGISSLLTGGSGLNSLPMGGGAMPNGAGTLPGSGAMPNGAGTLPGSGAMPNGAGTLSGSGGVTAMAAGDESGSGALPVTGSGGILPGGGGGSLPNNISGLAPNTPPPVMNMNAMMMAAMMQAQIAAMQEIQKKMQCAQEFIMQEILSNLPVSLNDTEVDKNSTDSDTTSDALSAFSNNSSNPFGDGESGNFSSILSLLRIVPRLTMKGFDTEEEFTSRLKDDESLNSFIGGVVFRKNVYNDYKYTIRLHADPINVEKSDIPAFRPIADTWKTHQLFPPFQRPGPREKPDKYGGKPGYYNEGFLSLMHALNLAILSVKLNTTGEASPEVHLNRFPYPPYLFDNFLEAIQGMLPLTVLLSFFYTALTITKSVVNEKETKMKEYMMMMGLSNWMHWLAWFVKYLIFMMISCIFITILYKIQTSQGAVLTYSDGSVIFVYLTLYSAATISFCFMLSVFFSKANVAAAGGGVLFGLSYMPYLFIAGRYETLSIAEKSISCLLSNVAMANGVQILSNFESQGVGVQWYNIHQGVTVDDSFSFLYILLFFIFDIFIYATIAWYVEGVFPGEYGVPKPWNFPFKKSYWFGVATDINKEMSSEDDSILHVEDEEFMEPPPQDAHKIVDIRDLKKVFKTNGKVKVAVNGLNLQMYEGQITVLLGHNGAGKTTTMSILTGLYSPSGGEATIMGHSIRNDLQRARKSMGLCPQHNILYDHLTVDEHIYFFSRLKGLTHDAASKECESLANILQLSDKREQLSRTLSGGMKRKLSVGIALAADSKFVVLDEPTAGMDPAARRAIWDVLQLYSDRCSMLVSTHFMDEADLLGDRIAIMAEGKLRCVGSSVFLKNKFGVGYHVVLTTNPQASVEKITDLFTSCVPDAKFERASGAELSFLLPFYTSSLFPQLFNSIEDQKEGLGIESYGASITTMEEVFLSVTEDSHTSVKTVSERRLSLSNVSPEQPRKENVVNGTDKCNEYLVSDPLLVEVESCSADSISPDGKLNTGFVLWFQQFYALLIKKIIHSKRNYKVIIAQLLVPVLFVVIAVINAQNSPLLETNKNLDLRLNAYGKTIINYKVEDELKNGVCHTEDCYYAQQFQGSDFASTFNVPSAFENMEEYLSDKYANEGGGFNSRNVIAAEFKKNNSSNDEISTAWFNAQGFHTPANTLLYLDQAYLRSKLNSSNLTLDVTNFPLERNASYQVQEQLVGSISGFMISFNLILGFSFLTASFALFLVRERVEKAALLQRLAGVDPLCFWLSAFAWDIINFLIPCILTIIVFAVSGMNEYIENGNIWITALMLFLFGWSSLPLTYLLSFLFTIPSTALVTITVLADITGIATVITINVLRILQEDDVVAILDWIFLLLPQYCIGQGLSDFYTNNKMIAICTQDEQMEAICKAFGIDFQTNFLAWEPYGIGRFVTFMVWEGVVLILLLLAIEYDVHGLLIKLIKSIKRNITNNYTTPDEDVGVATMAVDGDVALEQERIANTPIDQLQKTDLLFVKNLRKVYYRKKDKNSLSSKLVAVQNLSVGIQDKQCFGLLGINGAGKTTTFKMLTGDIRPTFGEAYLAGYDIFGSTKQAQQLMGYCPQFDALIDQMTGKETLVMYGRLRGIPEKQISSSVRKLSKMLTLEEHIDKPCGTYSGGNKRKLSVAMSLIGDPTVVLLDEPSTGMDPGARRMLWDAISEVSSSGRCVIITSHNMEECEALCTRLAIMVNGEFKCLGGPQHLKNKFGEGYSLEVKMKSGNVAMDTAKGFFFDNFPGCTITDEHQGILSYHIPSKSPDGSHLSLAKVFQCMEDAKTADHLMIEDYSVSQTTLEQVFLSFAKRQRESDETDA